MKESKSDEIDRRKEEKTYEGLATGMYYLRLKISMTKYSEPMY